MERPKPVKRQKARNAEYYDMQRTQDDLYKRSLNNQNFIKLMDIIQCDENIMLAYRNIKRNGGSQTPGTDGKTIENLEKLSPEQLTQYVRSRLKWYKPQSVRRVEIPKGNGKTRPLGIPTIADRLIQQCFLQVLEPICEAKFHDRSYGFRPLRSAQNAMAVYPVIIIDQYIPGIAAYIESIEQEVVFLFDEFDKTFGSVCPGANEADPQSALLSMFDGTAQGKKLFIVTCNSLYKLNDYLVNRPGRFHYHFRFDYPSPEEIQAYLTDKLRPAYIGEIRKVILFSKKVALNYDCLRAIAFELNLGLPFEKAIQDLNIINLHEECYNVTLHFHGGRTMTAKRCQLDLFGDDRSERVCLQDEHGRDQLIVEFDPRMCVYDYERHATIVPAEALSLDYIEYYEEETVAEIKKLVPDYLSLTRAAERNLHYLTA